MLLESIADDERADGVDLFVAHTRHVYLVDADLGVLYESWYPM